MRIAAVFCPNFSTPTVFAVDTIQEITQHCEAVGEKLEERLGLGGGDGREERGREKGGDFLSAIKGRGWAEEKRGKDQELGPPRWGFGVAPLFVQIYAHKRRRIVVIQSTLKVAERRKAWPSGPEIIPRSRLNRRKGDGSRM